MANAWTTYLARTAAAHTATDIARRMRISDSTVSRWKNGNQPTPAAAVAFARTYGRPGIEALVAAGHLDLADLDESITVISPPPGLDSFSTLELVEEVARRLADAE